MNRFVSVMEAIGKGFEKGLAWAVQYAVPVERLVGMIFPAAAPEMAAVGAGLGLVQNAVLAIEQKYAASGKATGTGAQKLADVTTLVAPTVIQLLQQAGITVDSAYVGNLVSAVVAILNVQMAPPAATA